MSLCSSRFAISSAFSRSLPSIYCFASLMTLPASFFLSAATFLRSLISAATLPFLPRYSIFSVSSSDADSALSMSAENCSLTFSAFSSIFLSVSPAIFPFGKIRSFRIPAGRMRLLSGCKLCRKQKTPHEKAHGTGQARGTTRVRI